MHFFKYISSTKKNPEQFKEFTEFQNHWTPWNSMFGIKCIPQLFFIPQVRFSPIYFENSPISSHPVKPNLKSSNPPPPPPPPQLVLTMLIMVNIYKLQLKEINNNESLKLLFWLFNQSKNIRKKKYFNPIQNGPFWGCSWMEECQNAPPPQT